MAAVVSPNPTPLVNPVTPVRPSSAKSPLLFAVIIILAGIISGFFLNKWTSPSSGTASVKGENMINTATEIGSTDTKTYSDTATGIIEAGGTNGEGTHKLIRDEKDPSKTAYLVSSVVDLDQFVGKKVDVWGQTMKAQKVGWLMDVGRVKILD